MPNNPVQVILNTRDYFVAPDPGRLGPGKDFFEGRDQEFVQHRDRLLRQVGSISTAFRRSGASSGVVKISLNREALAKSHRPHRALFPPEKRPCIGASKLGELYYHVTVEDVDELGREIAIAEPETRRRTSKTGKEYVAPSDQRSDAGAIDSIEIPTASDKRRFGVEEAVHWLADPRTSHAYFVELFSPPPTYLPAVVSDYLHHTISDITRRANAVGLEAETFPVDIPTDPMIRPSSVFGFRIVKPGQPSVMNDSVDAHRRLLGLLDAHPYVRSVLLPPVVVAARLHTGPAIESAPVQLPVRDAERAYPKIGVIDGGMSTYLTDWVIGTHTIVAPEHMDTNHATFIGGLIVAGQHLNGTETCGEPDGCDVFDIGILPDDAQAQAFEAYYPNGVVDFFAEVEVGIEEAKRSHGIRVFNMSLNLLDPVQGDSYGIVANLLDRIADKHGVLIILSAGNLDASDCRSEWPANAQSALQQLAARAAADTILQPAESSRCLAVGALNPPGCTARTGAVPSAYTRRGPGLRVGVKPDLVQYGGAMPDGLTDTGLRSLGSDGRVVFGHGTSYAAPLVAKTAATLCSRVQSELSREMVVALLIHGCELPSALRDPLLAEVARQFAGFGIPKSADDTLFTPDHAITLVFCDVLHAHRKLQFDFAWPRGLVNARSGACRGQIRMTLVYRPLINRDFGTEFVRINIDAHLRQEDRGGYVNRLRQAFLPADGDEVHYEHELIRHGLKWWPTKVYQALFRLGKGTSSNWQLGLESLVRADEVFPPAGVPFALVLTISDPRETAPVFNDLRLHLTSHNVQIVDIRTTTQIRVQP